jgi:hypothetical protein
MGGLILDNIVVYLIKMVMLSVREFRSRNWTLTEGVVESSHSYEGMYPYAAVNYTYKVNGESNYGTYYRGFWYSDSTISFADSYPPLRKIVIRCNPVRPSESFLCEGDQLSQDVPNQKMKKSDLGPIKTPWGEW